MAPEVPLQTVTRVTIPSNQHAEPIDPVFLTLLGATIFFAVMTAGIARWSPNDGQTFQIIGGLATGFAGACLGRVKPAGSGSTTTTKTTAPGESSEAR